MASKKKKGQNHLVVISVILLVFVVISVFLCIKAYVEKQKNKEILITNTITMNYTDDYNGLIAYPLLLYYLFLYKVEVLKPL